MRCTVGGGETSSRWGVGRRWGAAEDKEVAVAANITMVAITAKVVASKAAKEAAITDKEVAMTVLATTVTMLASKAIATVARTAAAEVVVAAGDVRAVAGCVLGTWWSRKTADGGLQIQRGGSVLDVRIHGGAVDLGEGLGRSTAAAAPSTAGSRGSLGRGGFGLGTGTGEADGGAGRRQRCVVCVRVVCVVCGFPCACVCGVRRVRGGEKREDKGIRGEAERLEKIKEKEGIRESLGKNIQNIFTT